MWLTVLSGAAIGGVAAMYLGVRGKRVGTHRVCRNCQYDLAGTPDAAKCPECGVDLSSRRATRVGVRIRRTKVLIGGIAAFLGAGVPAALVAGHRLRHTDWSDYKPEWLLVRELRSTDPIRNGNAASAVLNRIENGSWSGGRLAGILHDYTATMPSPAARADLLSSGWYEAHKYDRWLDVLGAAGREGLLSNDQATRLIEHQLIVTADVRTVVPSGSVAPIRWQAGAESVCGIGDARRGVTPLGITSHIQTVTLSGRIVYEEHADHAQAYPGRAAGGTIDVPFERPPGQHWLTVTLAVHVWVPTVPDEPVRTIFRDLGWWIAVIPPGSPVVRLVDDESLEPAMSVWERPRSGERRISNGETRLWTYLVRDGLPVPVVGRVTLRWQEDGVTRFIPNAGSVTSHRTEDARWEARGVIDVSTALRVPDEVDVIIEPDVKLAEESTTVWQQWGRAIEIRDVAFQSLRP